MYAFLQNNWIEGSYIFIVTDQWKKAGRIKVWTNCHCLVSDHCYHGFYSTKN